MTRIFSTLAKFVWQPSRERSISAGVVLLAVPTIFTLVPGLAQWPREVRGLILFGWLFIAIIAVFAETKRDSIIDNLAAARSSHLENLRLSGLNDVLEALLQPGVRGIPKTFEFTVYLFDEESSSLQPYYPKLLPPRDPDPRVFKVGKGATGTAWENKVVVVVRGEDVSNEAYGLTGAQQEYFAGHRSVASAVIWEKDTRPIGVLTAISTSGTGYFDNQGGRDSLIMLAQTLGVALDRIPEPSDLEP